MVIQLNRFSMENMAKVRSTVWAEVSIVLPTGETFRLHAIGHRTGNSQSGHYWASIKMSGN